MNKWIKFGILAVLSVAVIFTGVSVAAAHGEDPPLKQPAGARGLHHGMWPGPGLGLMADYQEDIHEALADALGISVADFEDAIDEGETLASLAEIYEVDFEDLRQAMEEARADLIEAAVESGAITKEQAEWMQQGPGMWGPRGPRTGGCYGEDPLRDGSVEYGPRGGLWGGRR